MALHSDAAPGYGPPVPVRTGAIETIPLDAPRSRRALPRFVTSLFALHRRRRTFRPGRFAALKLALGFDAYRRRATSKATSVPPGERAERGRPMR